MSVTHLPPGMKNEAIMTMPNTVRVKTSSGGMDPRRRNIGLLFLNGDGFALVSARIQVIDVLRGLTVEDVLKFTADRLDARDREIT